MRAGGETAHWKQLTAEIDGQATSFAGFGTAGEAGRVCGSADELELKLQAKNGAGWSPNSQVAERVAG